MGIKVTPAEYFGPYAGHPDATPEVVGHAHTLLSKVNAVYVIAHGDGCELPDNPFTKSGVSGQGNGGFRPQECPVGAKNSSHKTGHGIDRFDPARKFAAWCIAHQDVLAEYGLYMEDPRWTPTWVHLSDVAPKSGKRVFIPSPVDPLCGMPEPWGVP